jgi:heat-inducible transcriptional repressor
MATSDLNPRSGRVLTTVVREYIQTGEPVASVVVARRGSLGVSSATIRSVLARLEEQGFVRQPHTSAGRVPTDRGYRFYVDLLLESRRPGDRSAVADQIRQVASEESSFDRLLAQVSHVLSQDSHHVGFALAPATDDQRLQKIEFVSVGGSRVLVLTVAESGHVTQKIVETIDVLSPEELRRAAECVNREFSGLAIEDVRARILARLQTARGLYDRLHEHALQMADRALDARSREQTLYVDGTSSLLAEAETSQQHAELSLRTLRALVEMIEEKQRLVRLLSQYLEGPGLAVVIGAEHRLPDLKPFSLIAASYLDGRRSGSVGIIGPTRMRYSRAIGAVESAARAVGEALGRN